MRRGRWVEVFDPANGVRRFSLGETSKHFSGVALELTPAASFRKRASVERVKLADLWSKAGGFVPSILQVLALSVMLEIFGLLSPLVNQMIVDDAIAKGDLDLLTVMVIGGALLLTGGLISVGLDGLMALITLGIMLLYAPLLTGVAAISLALFVGARLGMFPWLKRLYRTGLYRAHDRSGADLCHPWRRHLPRAGA